MTKYNSVGLLAHTKMWEELERAAEDLKKCTRSFYYGYKNALIALGYEAYGCDSKTTFRHKDGVFYFSVCAWNDWKISNTATIKTDNGDVNLSIKSQEEFMRDWKYKGLTEQDLIYHEPKPIEYKEFWVCDTGYSRPYMKCFTDFDEAKKDAYQTALDLCNKRNDKNNSLRQYYCASPIDKTEYNKPYLLFYEYYIYNESSQGIYIYGVENV